MVKVVVYVHGHGTTVAFLLSEGNSIWKVKSMVSNGWATIGMSIEGIMVKVMEEVVILKSSNHMLK